MEEREPYALNHCPVCRRIFDYTREDGAADKCPSCGSTGIQAKAKEQDAKWCRGKGPL